MHENSQIQRNLIIHRSRDVDEDQMLKLGVPENLQKTESKMVPFSDSKLHF